MRIFILCSVLIFSNAAYGNDLKNLQAANALGSILASEKICGFIYDQSAIEAWIDSNTDPADMSFASTLNGMTAGATYEIQNQGESERIAHCHAVERIAKHYGFIK